MKRLLAPLFLLSVAVSLAPASPAGAPPLAVHPQHVRFGRQPYESSTLRSFHVTNRTRRTLVVTIEQVRVGDDFSPGQVSSTCALGETLLAPGETCRHDVGFRPSEFFGGHETAEMRVLAHELDGTPLFRRRVRLSGTGY